MQDDANEVVVMHASHDLYEAEIIRNELHDAGIACELDGESQGGFTELVETKVLVRAWDADTFRRDLHKDLKADFVLANPPFNDSDWHRSDDDVRWKYGTPPKGNANFAWVQHFIHHLASGGFAGFVLANGSMSSNQSGEGEIRRSIIEADLVDCMVALPGQLFYSTQIPVCLWFLTRNKSGSLSPAGERAGVRGKKMRDRRGETLFIDARKLGTMIDRVHRELTDEEIQRLSQTYHACRGDPIENRKSKIENYADLPGFCRSATKAEIAEHGYVLTPGRYVGAEEVEDDDERFEDKMQRLTKELNEQFAQSADLETRIRDNLASLSYDLGLHYPDDVNR